MLKGRNVSELSSQLLNSAILSQKVHLSNKERLPNNSKNHCLYASMTRFQFSAKRLKIYLF